MRCVRPLVLRNRETGQYSSFSCNQCKGCRLRRKLGWVGRLHLESRRHQVGRFITLTYRDHNRPEVLEPKVLSDFMKRYRHHYGECRFFGVGEYGEENGNGHFHVIIFGHQAEVAGAWRTNKAWEFGFSGDAPLTLGRIKYTAGYVLKKHAGGDRQPFIQMSLKPGIGFDTIREWAVSCPRDLGAWPHEYRIGRARYPLCQGGLAVFKAAYIESGGLPPFIASPEMRDAEARALRLEWGTRDSRSDESIALWRREHADAQALPSRR